MRSHFRIIFWNKNRICASHFAHEFESDGKGHFWSVGEVCD